MISDTHKFFSLHYLYKTSPVETFSWAFYTRQTNFNFQKIREIQLNWNRLYYKRDRHNCIKANQGDPPKCFVMYLHTYFFNVNETQIIPTIEFLSVSFKILGWNRSWLYQCRMERRFESHSPKNDRRWHARRISIHGHTD